MSNCRFVMGLLQASHTPPPSSWEPPHDWAMVGRMPKVIPRVWSKLTIRATDHRGARLRRMLHALVRTARSTPSVPGSTRWSGIGHDVVGMARLGYDLQLTQYDEKCWRATPYTTHLFSLVRLAGVEPATPRIRSSHPRTVGRRCLLRS
jgi:hypothetical protein